jgi:hypothetical protein
MDLDQTLGWLAYAQIFIAVCAGIIMIWMPSLSDLAWKCVKTNFIVFIFLLITSKVVEE